MAADFVERRTDLAKRAVFDGIDQHGKNIAVFDHRLFQLGQHDRRLSGVPRLKIAQALALRLLFLVAGTGQLDSLLGHALRVEEGIDADDRVGARLHQSPRNALIELVLRQGLDQQIVATLPGGFPQRRASRRSDTRRIDRFAQMSEYLPDHFAFVDEGDDLHHAAAFWADDGEHFVYARQQHRPHKPCRLTDGRFLRSASALALPLPSSVAISGDSGAAASAVTALRQGELGASTP